MQSIETGWRGSAEIWLETAYDSFIEAGVEAVRILPLAKKLKLSRTSFYWFFKDRDALLAALVDRWRNKNTGGIVKQCSLYADSPAEAILNLFDCWLDPTLFDSQFEYAIRSWALQSTQISAEIDAADAARLEAVTRLFARYGYDPVAADARARATYLTQIGYIAAKTVEDLPLRMQRIPHYVEIFTGRAPRRRELRRFFTRHGYVEATRTDGVLHESRHESFAS
jgi:AcrR family transcriptional regulator